MRPEWTGDVIGKLHVHGLSIKELAESMGYSHEYLSVILNGKREPTGIKEKVEDAVNKLIEQRKESENGKHSSFEYQNNKVRTVDVEGEAWFVLKDVCEILRMDTTQLKKSPTDWMKMKRVVP